MPDDVIEVKNDGQRIVSTNYWDTLHADAGRAFCSVNAGAVRILMPPALEDLLPAMQSGKYCVISIGRWPSMRQDQGVEILFQDDTDSPLAMHFSANSFDVLPGDPGGKLWTVAVWLREQDHPVLEWMPMATCTRSALDAPAMDRVTIPTYHPPLSDSL